MHSLTLCSCEQRSHRVAFLHSLAEWPNCWHLKHCITWGGSRLASHRYNCQPILTPCFWAALTWLLESVRTRIYFVGWPIARLVFRVTLLTFIALMFRSSAFISSSLMLWCTFIITKLGLVFGLGSVLLAFTVAFGKARVRFTVSIRHSLEARFSGWKKNRYCSSTLLCALFWPQESSIWLLLQIVFVMALDQ